MYLVVILEAEALCKYVFYSSHKFLKTIYIHFTVIVVSLWLVWGMGDGWWATDDVGTGRWAAGEVIYVKHFHSLNSSLVKVIFIIP